VGASRLRVNNAVQLLRLYNVYVRYTNDLVWRIGVMILTGKTPEVLGENPVSVKVLNPLYVSYKITTFVNRWVDYVPWQAQRY
jgi:hypothetical protein